MRAFLLAFVVASSFSSLALADEPTGRVIVMPEVPIVGRRQVPIVSVLSRSRMHYRAPELERHATDAILESVTHPPF
jgi:hypothetical protein